MNKTIIIVDMINDFVTGKFGSRQAQDIIPNIDNLCKKARGKNIPIIYLSDSHTSNDIELKIWGPHAMKGTEGAKIVSELKPEKEDTVIFKSDYSGFVHDTLSLFLKKFGTEILIFTGISTDICIQNNVAYAYHMGYKTIVVSDCTASIDKNTHEYALKYMKNIYGTEIMRSEELEL